MSAAARTTLAGATAGRDDEFEHALVTAILTAIADVSRVTDRAAIVIRTGETASALLCAAASAGARSALRYRGARNVRHTRDGSARLDLANGQCSTLAMSPAATRSPAALRKTVDELGKKLRRRFGAAESCPDFADLKRRCFRDGNNGGRG